MTENVQMGKKKKKEKKCDTYFVPVDTLHFWRQQKKFVYVKKNTFNMSCIYNSNIIYYVQ